MKLPFLILLFALVHYIYDFVVQTREIAAKKALVTRFMMYHVLEVYAFLIVILVWFYPITTSLIIALINTFFHFIIDTTIWNAYKKARNYDTTYPYWSDKWFYIVLGGDQFLHMAVFIVSILLYT